MTTGTASFGNVVGADVVTPGTVVINTSGRTSGSGHLNAGSHTGVQTLSSIGGIDAGNYSYAGVAGNYTVNALNLNVSGLTAGSKVYDGGTAATVNTAGASYNGLLVGDAVTVSATGAFADKNAAAGKTVTLTSSYSGADAGNYHITGQASAGADITARALTVSATGVNKVYDGGNTAAIVLRDNRIANDVLSLSSTTASFADKNVAAGKTVSVSGIGVTGADAGNYTFNTTANTSADITPATLSYVAAPASMIAGQTPAGLSGTVSGFVAGDTLANASTGTLAWSTPVTTTSPAGQHAINGAGLSASNYVFVQASGNAGALTVKPGALTLEPDALTVKPGIRPEAVGNAIPQLASDAFSCSLGGSGMGPCVSPTGGGLAKETVAPAFQVLNDGIRLPDTRVDANE